VDYPSPSNTKYTFSFLYLNFSIKTFSNMIFPVAQENGGAEGTGCSHTYVQGKKYIAESVYQQEVARWENGKPTI
jgi:hypothetical protein